MKSLLMIVLGFSWYIHAMDDAQPTSAENKLARIAPKKLKCKKLKLDGKNKPYKVHKFSIQQHMELSQNPENIILLESVGASTFVLYELDLSKKKLKAFKQLTTEAEKVAAIMGSNDAYAIESISAETIQLNNYKDDISQIIQVDQGLYCVFFTSLSDVVISNDEGQMLMKFPLEKRWGGIGEMACYANGQFAVLHHDKLQGSSLYVCRRKHR